MNELIESNPLMLRESVLIAQEVEDYFTPGEAVNPEELCSQLEEELGCSLYGTELLPFSRRDKLLQAYKLQVQSLSFKL